MRRGIGLFLVALLPDPAAADEAAAVAVLTAAKASLTRDAALPGNPVVQVQLNEAPTDETFDALGRLARLRTLRVGLDKPARLDAMAAWPALEELHLFSRALRDDDLPRLAGLKRLRALLLFDAPITDAGLKHFAKVAGLESLGLQDARIDGSGLKDLAGLDRLRELDIIGGPLTRHGLEALAALRQVRRLGLVSPALDGTVLATVAKMPALEVLRFEPGKLDGKALAGLGVLASLKELRLEGRLLDDDAVVALAEGAMLHKLSLARTERGAVATRPEEVFSLRLTDAKITSVRAWRCLAVLPNLRRLDVDPARIGDGTLLGLRDANVLHALERFRTEAGNRPTRLADVTAVHLAGTAVTGPGLKVLADCPDLGVLNLLGANVVPGRPKNGVSLDALPRLAKVHSLHLSPGTLDDATLRRLAALGLLHALVTDAARRPGEKPPASPLDVRSLALGGSGVTAAGLKELHALKNLEILGLAATPLTDADLSHLAGFGALRELSLDRCRVTRAGMATLAELPALERLFVREVKSLADDDLRPLADSKSLKAVFVTGTKATPALAEEFKTKGIRLIR